MLNCIAHRGNRVTITGLPIDEWPAIALTRKNLHQINDSAGIGEVTQATVWNCPASPLLPCLPLSSYTDMEMRAVL